MKSKTFDVTVVRTVVQRTTIPVKATSEQDAKERAWDAYVEFNDQWSDWTNDVKSADFYASEKR